MLNTYCFLHVLLFYGDIKYEVAAIMLFVNKLLVS